MYSISDDNQFFYVDDKSYIPNVLRIYCDEQWPYACVPNDDLLGDVADCLNDAERIMSVLASASWVDNSVNSLACDYPSTSEENIGSIGWTKERNHEVVNSIDDSLSNGAVNPEVGEAYFIYDIDRRVGYSPYHAAAVIAKDENYNYTLETFDGYQGYSFNCYEISPGSQNTFHAHWLERYYDGIGKTIKIKYFPQDLPEVDSEEEPIGNSEEDYSYFSSQE